MDALDKTFTALSDSRRRAILAGLHEREMSFSEIAEPFGMTQTGVTRHINILKNADLVRVSKKGRTRYCQLNADPMREAIDWLKHYEGFWTGILGHLAEQFEDKTE
ncbi:MAG: metalloregulator ArsR/SmtB family transcription factor [Sneathiellales bacterium]|nr:metalloregulator ArsR/SmtB family transcription factor [Sneathiellales bacterium]